MTDLERAKDPCRKDESTADDWERLAEAFAACGRPVAVERCRATAESIRTGRRYRLEPFRGRDGIRISEEWLTRATRRPM